MALNRELDSANQIVVPVPEETKSGDPLIIGELPCVALIDANADGEASVQCDGAFRLSVEGVNNEGNTKIEPGDIIYMKEGVLGADDVAGVRFGYALGTVEAGATATIVVKIGY